MQASDGKLYGMTQSGGVNNSGVLFQYDPVTATYTKKIDFNGTLNGSYPYGSLIQASDGKLYGTTSSGGVNGKGVLFQYDPVTSTYAKKIDFSGTINGSNPYGSLKQASDGKLYGMTYAGGVNNKGVLFQYDPVTSTYIKKIDFNGTTNGSAPYGSLIQGSNSKLYGMTTTGGVNGLGVLFEYNPVTSTYTKKTDFNITNGATPQFGNLIEISICNLSATVTQTNVSCNGGTNATASVSVTSGAGSYTYLWLPSGGTTSIASGLAAGNYTCTITDANSCSITKTVNITQPIVLNATVSQTNVSTCYGLSNGSARIDYTGGVGAYNIVWSAPISQTIITGALTTSVSGVAAGNYSCIITDANSCSITKTFTINQPAAVSVSTGTTNSICAGNTVALSALATGGSGGTYTYTWMPGNLQGANQNVAPTGNTDYTVTATDANGCENIAISSLTVNAIPSISVNSGSITIGNSFTMTPTGATTYTFSNGSAVVTPTINSNYTVTGTSSLGCVNSTGVVSSVTVIGAPIPSTQLTSTFCNTTLTTLDANTRPRCNAVANAVDYEWQFTDVSSGLVVFTKQRVAPYTDFYLMGYWPACQYNKTYSVKVRAKVGSTWGNYGNACTLTTPVASLASTELTSIYCNSTLTSFNTSTIIRCNPVTGATDYEYQFTDVSNPSLVYTKKRNAQWSDLYLATVSPQLQANKTYNVVVRAYVNSTWGTFGNACTISIPAPSARYIFADTEETEMGNGINVNAYPNPTTETLNIDFDNMPGNASVEIYNMVGELVINQPLTDLKNIINTSKLSTGLYLAKIIGNNKLLSIQKIVKQ